MKEQWCKIRWGEKQEVELESKAAEALPSRDCGSPLPPAVLQESVRGPLTAVASPIAEHRLQTRRLSGHGSRAQPLRGVWDPPGPGRKPASPASAGGLSTTAPPGKPLLSPSDNNSSRMVTLPHFAGVTVEGQGATGFTYSFDTLSDATKHGPTS